MARLNDMRVAITGGSSGIGVAAASMFAREGADVAVLARSRPGLARAAELVEEHGRRAHAIEVDLAEPGAGAAAVDDAAARLGGIDVFVSNAAASAFGPFRCIPAEDFDRSVAITFGGAVSAIRAALPHLDRSRGTLIANVSTVSKTPVPLQSPYVASKHALRGLLGSLRVELLAERSPVDVCMVHPAPVDTPFWNHATSAIGRRPRPLRSTYSVETVAAAIVECAVSPRAEVTVGGSGLAMNLLSALAQPVSDRVLATYGVWGQIGDAETEEPGAVWQGSGDGTLDGGFGGRVSLFTALRLMAPRLLRPPRV